MICSSLNRLLRMSFLPIALLLSGGVSHIGWIPLRGSGQRGEDVNEWHKQDESLYFIGVSAKRYVLYNRLCDGTYRIRKFSSHGMGTYASRKDYVPAADIPTPHKNVHKLGGERWSYDLWYRAIVDIEGKVSRGESPHHEVSVDENKWLDNPAFHQVTLSTWDLLRTYSADYDGQIAGLRPFSLFTVLPPIEFRPKFIARIPSNSPFIAPYCPDLATLQTALADGRVRYLARADKDRRVASERGWVRTTPDGEYPMVYKPAPMDIEFKSVADVFRKYFVHPETPAANASAIGVLSPRRVYVGMVRVCGKESHEAWVDIVEDSDGVLGAAAVIDATDYGADAEWRYALKPYRIGDLMIATGLLQQTLTDMRNGTTTHPSVKTRDALRRGLWLLSPANPQHILNWRDIPAGWLAEHVPGWNVEIVQLVRRGKARISEDERAAFIAAVRLWEDEYADRDHEPARVAAISVGGAASM
jgi:hypothetical protein